MSDWIKHNGLSDPFSRTVVEVKMRDGTTDMGTVGEFDWESSPHEPESDIIEYRIVEPST